MFINSCAESFPSYFVFFPYSTVPISSVKHKPSHIQEASEHLDSVALESYYTVSHCRRPHIIKVLVIFVLPFLN